MHIVWDHTTPINGTPADIMQEAWGLSQDDIVVLVGPSPPHTTTLIQATDDNGEPFQDEAAALAWGAANEPPPPPDPGPPPPLPPTVEHLATEVDQLRAVCDAQQVMIDDLVGMLLDPAASMSALEEPPI